MYSQVFFSNRKIISVFQGRVSSFNLICIHVLFSSYVDAESLNAAIKAIKYEPGHTFTAEAMKRALAHYETNMRDDDETAKVTGDGSMVKVMMR